MQPPPQANHVPLAANRATSRVVPHEPTALQNCAAFLVWLIVRIVTFTVRYRYHDPHGFFNTRPAPQAIYCIWHNRLALCLKGYLSFARINARTPGIAAMASASKDGAFLAAIIKWFGVKPVRGSSSRRGPQALLELTHWAARGWDLAITPDGPRGPRYRLQGGPLALAQLTGLAIIPAGCNLNWKIQLNTWDKFQIPIPFARCDVVVGKPLLVPRDTTDEQREAMRAALEKELHALNKD